MSNKDHKSNQKNPTTEAYQKMLDNRSNQLNPNHPEYKGMRNDNKKQKNSISTSSVYAKDKYGFGFWDEKPFSYDPLENFPLFK